MYEDGEEILGEGRKPRGVWFGELILCIDLKILVPVRCELCPRYACVLRGLQARFGDDSVPSVWKRKVPLP